MNRHSLLQTTTRLLLGFFAISALQGWNSNAQSPERFVPTGNMTTVRVFHTATLLKDGRVLIAGGELTNNRSDPVSLASAELYDPLTGRFSPTGSMTTAREKHSATLLPDGRVLIAGGYGYSPDFRNNSFFTSTELYDPVTGTFTPGGEMIDSLFLPVATPLNNGKVLISGGHGRVFPEARAELYDPAVGTFNRIDMASVTGSKAEPLF